jgi:L-fuculose-phosphate aldolase
MALNRKLLRNLAELGRKVSRYGFVIGEGGNISARDGDIVYIKRKGASMGEATANAYIPLDIKTGKPLRKTDKPSTEIYMHLECYRTRKYIGAVIHSHPVFTTALGILNVNLKPLSYEMAVNLNSDIARIGYMKPGTPQLGRAVGRAIRKHNAILLKNHGLVTVGRNLDEAFLRTLAIERGASVYICCKLLGKVGFSKKVHLTI